MKYIILFQRLKLRKVCGQISETNWRKHLTISLRHRLGKMILDGMVTLLDICPNCQLTSSLTKNIADWLLAAEHLGKSKSVLLRNQFFNCFKAELLQEGIFFLIHLFSRDVLLMKKLEIEKTKPTFIISVLKVEY